MAFQSRSVLWLLPVVWAAACSSPNRDLGSDANAGAAGAVASAGSSGKGSAGSAGANAGRAGAASAGSSSKSGAAGATEEAGAGQGGEPNSDAGAGGAGPSGAGRSSGGAGAPSGGAGAPSGGGGAPTGGGGAATGGGGAANGGGGAANGGGGAAGAPNTNQFVGGPCATAPSLTSVEVFGRGSDHNLYRRAISSSDFGTWQSLVGVDGSKLDARSDLDCASTLNAIDLVGTGVNGEYYRAVGFGTAYNPFSRELPTYSLNPSAAIAMYPNGNYAVAGVGTTGFVAEEVDSGTPTLWSALPSNQDLRSAPDLAAQPSTSSSSVFAASFDSNGRFAIETWLSSSAGTAWQTPVTLLPPSGASFAFSPSICVASGEGGGNGNYDRHVVAVVTGGNVFHAIATTGNALNFGTWEQIDTGATSAPDCTVLNDTTVHVVALHSGKITDVYGNTGSWTKKDLGTF